jgi:DNA-binding NarL/FixJ family response regulator
MEKDGKIPCSYPVNALWRLVRSVTVILRSVQLSDVRAVATRSPARVLVIDDHPIVRLGIRQMIAADPELTVCGEAATAEEALQRLKASGADLAIVDLSLRGQGGLQLIRSLLDIAPRLHVLVLSMHDETLFSERALKAGARGYIMKHEAIAGLARAIREVLAGHIYLSEQMSQRLLERVRPGTPPATIGVDALTDRELEVFTMIGRGISTAEMARKMGISIKTIETYRSNIKVKLDLADASELLRYATSWFAHL